MLLIYLVSGRIIEDDGEADGVGIIDDIAWRHGRRTGEEMTDGGNSSQKLFTVPNQLLARGWGSIIGEPEIDGVNEHGEIVGWGLPHHHIAASNDSINLLLHDPRAAFGCDRGRLSDGAGGDAVGDGAGEGFSNRAANNRGRRRLAECYFGRATASKIGRV